MGKSKQTKEKKFDRNVEISAPILDPEIIRRIHSPPKGQRLDVKNGGFKALLSDFNSQDSTDEMSPLNDNHVPSYIGISCAVSGYSNYSSYNKRPSASPILRSEITSRQLSTPNRSRTTSPTAHRINHHGHHENHHVHHITIDKNNIQSPDEERKELTEKLTASAAEHRRSPSPIPPTEDDRHHGTYVGARYCPLPDPSELVNKHIPLLGIDDEQDPDEASRDGQGKKMEQKIANLYGDEFVEDWRESMTHKAKKELPEDQGASEQHQQPAPRDLVTLKPTPAPVKRTEEDDNGAAQLADLPAPSAKVLAGVERQFLNKLLTDENPPVPSPPPYLQSPTRDSRTKQQAEEPPAPGARAESRTSSPAAASPVSPEPTKQQLDERLVKTTTTTTTTTTAAIPDYGEEHIEYEIRAQSPVDNEASPVRVRSIPETEQQQRQQQSVEEKLVSFTPEPQVNAEPTTQTERSVGHEAEPTAVESNQQQQQQQPAATSEANDGRYYMNLLEQEKSFILKHVAEAEAILEAQESQLDEDTKGKIRSAIGKANLLVNKKCNQFRELCEANMNASANEQYATLNDDLAGFWDMVRIQIEDVRKSFENIWTAKANNWNSSSEVVAADSNQAAADSGDDDGSRESSLKERSGGNSKPILSAAKDQERRERLKEHINQMKQNQAARTDEADLLEADLEQVGCDSIETRLAAPTESKSARNESEDQLFSLMGSGHDEQQAIIGVTDRAATNDDKEESKKLDENLVDLLD